jgi:hypothetical protein
MHIKFSKTTQRKRRCGLQTDFEIYLKTRMSGIKLIPYAPLYILQCCFRCSLLLTTVNYEPWLPWLHHLPRLLWFNNGSDCRTHCHTSKISTVTQEWSGYRGSRTEPVMLQSWLAQVYNPPHKLNVCYFKMVEVTELKIMMYLLLHDLPAELHENIPTGWKLHY